MSDGPRYTNPGNGGGADDVFRWSGDVQKGNQSGQQGKSGGDNYIYDGSGQGNGNGDQNHDAFHRDRMPGQIRESDYPQTFVQREVRGDGTVIINNIHCKNAFFNQSSIDGADYRRDPKQDFRNVDPDCARLAQRGQSGYYDTDRSPSNGGGRDYRDMQIEMARQRQFDQADARQREIEMARQDQIDQSYDRNRQIDYARQQQMDRAYQRDRYQGTGDFQQQYGGQSQRDYDQQLRIQMYNEQCRNANQRQPEQQLPYYVNDGCFGNGNNGGSWNNGGSGRYGRGHGGPCFDNNRVGISVRIPLGNSGGIRIGF